MVREETQQSTKQPQFYCENAEIPITEYSEMLGVTIDDKLKFEKHACGQSFLKSLSVNCRAQAYERDSPFWIKREHLFCIPSFPIPTIALRPGSSAVRVLVENLNRWTNVHCEFLNEKQTHHQELLNKIGLLSLTNQVHAKTVGTVFKSFHVSKSIKKRIRF